MTNDVRLSARLDIRLDDDLKAAIIKAAAMETLRREEKLSIPAAIREACWAWIEAVNNLQEEK